MRTIYVSMVVLLGILGGVHAFQKMHAENLARFFRVGQQWREHKEVFTENCRIRMAEQLKALNNTADTSYTDADYISFIENLLKEFSVQNMLATEGAEGFQYNLLVNKNKQVVLQFELVSAGNEIRINEIKNVGELVQYIKDYREKAPDKKLCQ